MTEKGRATDHVCRFADRLRWGPWTCHGILREREARRAPACAACGRERPARRPRAPERVEAEAERPTAPPDPDPAARAVAAELARRASAAGGETVPARGLLGTLVARGVPASLVEQWLDGFLRSGWVSLTWRTRGTRRTLLNVRLRASDAVEEFAHPGERAARRAALAEAREAVAGLAHPIGQEVARLLAEEMAEAQAPSLLRALAAVALHAESGEVLAARVFSARYLGDSKALGPLRARLEQLLGSLEVLGIRNGAAVTLLGGQGRLHAAGLDLDFTRLAPFAGLARETLEAVEQIDFPSGGLFVVENLAPFEACCRGEVEAARDALVIWAAGYPGRAVRAVVEQAARQSACVRAWADLDLDGVQIARLIASWSPCTFESYRMSPGDVAAAPVARPLSARSATAIRVDLAERPAALLADTLRALLAANWWVEQEAFLGR